MNTTLSTLLLLLFGVVLSVCAQQPDATPAPARPDNRPNLRQQLAQQLNQHPLQRWLRNQMNLLQRLDLTPEQAEQLKAIPARHETEWRELNRQTVRARRAFNELLLQNEPASPEMINQRARALGVAEARFAQLVAQVWNEVKAILTPEQLQRLNDLRVKQLEQIRERQMRLREGNQPPPADAPRPLNQRRLLRRQDKLPPDQPAAPVKP